MNAATNARVWQSCWLVLALLLAACGGEPAAPTAATSEGEAAAADYPRGPHNGRLLQDGDFAIELAIFETGVPPEFHAWPTQGGTSLPLGNVDLRVVLTRLGNETNNIGFTAAGDYLLGNAVVHEPHSFSVVVEASHQGAQHRWTYDSFEGRTRITPELSRALEIETRIAGAAVLHQSVETHGTITANTDYTRQITARFDGVIKNVQVSLGDRVAAGATLATLESNESLRTYTITAPIGGVVSHRNANPGEQSDGRVLLEITDPVPVWAELAIFPADRAAVQIGSVVTITPASGGAAATGTIAGFATEVGAAQTLIARVALDNSDGRFAPGTFVNASIDSGDIEVPLAVSREGLQAFRDFTVVFAKVGDDYEVRMLELGRQDADMIEVLGGLKPGTEYVNRNSYIIKADIEKSGASHDH